MLFASREIINSRREICKSCQFFSAGFCGTAITGKKVRYKNKTIRLCGCNMYVKSTFANVSCPANKWTSVGDLTNDEKKDIAAFLDTINRDYITAEQKKQLFALINRIDGVNEYRESNCVPCVLDVMNKIANSVK